MKLTKELEEMVGAGIEPDAPVADDGEQSGTDEEVGERHDRVGEDVGTGAVEPVHALTREDEAFLEEGGDAGDAHKSEEGYGEEVYREPVILYVE